MKVRDKALLEARQLERDPAVVTKNLAPTVARPGPDDGPVSDREMRDALEWRFHGASGARTTRPGSVGT